MSSRNPKVSVIVPNYNHATYLKQRIDSILHQTFQDFELIILDDCSSDNSKEIIESYRVNPHTSQIIYNTSNSGSAFKQWDKGIALAKGEWIWIAESDDYAELQFLEKVLSTVEDKTQYGFVYSDTRIVNENGETLYEMPADNTVEYFNGFEYLKYKLSIWNVSMTIFKRELFPQKAARELYESMKYCGDLMFYALLLEKTDVAVRHEILNNFRKHVGSISDNCESQGVGKIEYAKFCQYVIPKFPVALRWKRCMSLILGFCKGNHKEHYSVEIIKKFKREAMAVSFESKVLYYPISILYKLKNLCKRK